MSNLKIAIIGSTSHIAKGLINNFFHKSPCSLYLFTRSINKILYFLNSIGKSSVNNCVLKNDYRKIMNSHYDVIINCVGIGPPNKLRNNYSDWFMVTEKYDNLILGYLSKNPDTLYINFSSGAVYGKDNVAPVEKNTINSIHVNRICPEDYYSIANLNSEAKHRSFDTLKIVDLRIFAYFSKFIDLTSGYFITDLLNAILNKKTFETNDVNIVRDYVHPDDLFSFVLKCIKAGNINSAFDVVSAKPVEKQQILRYFSTNYSLKYKISGSLKIVDPNGTKNVYCSNYNNAVSIGYKPAFTSMDAIEHESEYLLTDHSTIASKMDV